MKTILFILLLSSYNCFAENPAIQVQNAFPNLSFSLPVFLTHAGDNTNRIFVVQQHGQIKVFPNDSNAITSQVKNFLTVNTITNSGELGLLGMAFHPDYETNGYFYVYYTSPSSWNSRISRFTRSASDPDKADSLSELKLMEIYQPYTNHKGGMLFFGLDGYLYISLGDGGNAGDPGNRAQNPDSIHGKILRIDVNNTTPPLNYAIPSDNPFASGGGRPEIFAMGFRNPWRVSQDAETGIIYAADVGQEVYEEIDIVEKGKNYGWRITEGFHCYNPSSGCDTSGITMPIKEYSHQPGGNCSVTGGYVYRGQRRPELRGAYIYSDYCSGRLWMLRYNNGVVTQDSVLIDTPQLVLSFGTDQNNELYYCASNGSIYRFNTSTLNTNVTVTTIPEGFYDTANNRLNMKDSVKVYLRENSSPYTIVDSASGILDSITFTSAVIFNKAISGNYYIVVKHRNSLETWSKAGGTSYTVATNVNYNFTTAIDQSFGSNMILVNGNWCMYSGDINTDGFINGNDFTNYTNEFSLTGYYNSDVNGDRNVNGNDFTIFSNNFGRSIIRP